MSTTNTSTLKENINDTPFGFPMTAGTVPTLDTRVSFTVCGETVTYELAQLETDPAGIISLLKLSLSERGAWLTVGAHYRRKGNFVAAQNVIRTMVEVMAELGVEDEQLYPAFLMLSGCETDLAKLAKEDGKKDDSDEQVSKHYRKSVYWLQRVYGRISNEPSGSDRVEGSSKPTQPNFHRNTPTGPRLHCTAPTSQAAGPKSLSLATNKEVGHKAILQREIQSLRDREANQYSILAETRVVKRQLEDDLDYERNIRRRLEVRLEDAERQLDNARRMERCVLDQVKREVEARRKAEDLVQIEIGKREGAEKRAEIAQQNAQRPLLENLASIFHRAAQAT